MERKGWVDEVGWGLFDKRDHVDDDFHSVEKGFIEQDDLLRMNNFFSWCGDNFKYPLQINDVLSAFFSLKIECEKLAQEKTEMQRHYVMVS